MSIYCMRRSFCPQGSMRKFSVKCISLKELKFIEIEEKGYYDYRIGMLRKVSKEIKYLCG
jgi:hypothetical protein